MKISLVVTFFRSKNAFIYLSDFRNRKIIVRAVSSYELFWSCCMWLWIIVRPIEKGVYEITSDKLLWGCANHCYFLILHGVKPLLVPVTPWGPILCFGTSWGTDTGSL